MEDHGEWRDENDNGTFYQERAEEEGDGQNTLIALYVITIAYSITFIFGVAGNGWVVFNLLRTRPWQEGGVTPSQRSRTYILVLALSDLLLLLTLPKTITFINTGDWMFGSIMCHISLAMEIFTKLFSVLILTAMSLERYFIVCTRWRHSVSHGLLYIPLSIALFFCVIIPMAVQIHYTQLIYLQDDMTGIVHRVCANAMPDFMFTPFVTYTFIMGFAAPLAIMALCYIFLVRHVRAKFRKRTNNDVMACKMVREPRYMNEMRKSIWRIAIYHFICWGPFWLFTISTMLKGGEAPAWLTYARLVANILPYVNAAGNWILYAVLNYDVRKHIYSGNSKNRRAFFFLTSVTL
ncbi:npr-27 [Pristionchus pacificus]|uniref:Npr-27 n=1 Tax=Pristionchus pacificus TaxID=54126 RepID=A0A2A6CBJ6_PRIPA|nr:npr-27 [Pristionchus pacificus]|eukprot:PDM75487.1 npr-27 [Pristionchus pacificus]